MPTLPDKSVDMILCDLPYGTTACKWDTIIPFESLWKEFKRLIKDRGVIALTASQPFTSALVMSNPVWFRHEWIWKKDRGSNFANTIREPMKEHESIILFSAGKWIYNPQMQNRKPAGLSRSKYDFSVNTKSDNYREFKREGKRNVGKLRVPSSVQEFKRETGSHPTQKPVALLEYLIRTYTNEGDLVMDNCAGSGTTGVACINTGRDFILIEKDAGYFAIIEKRIKEAQAQKTFPILVSGRPGESYFA